MSIPLEIYDYLIDSAEIDSEPKIKLWKPSRTMVVLGSSNDPEKECYVLQCENDNVPVIRRKGGGGAVLLTPGMLVFSLAFPGIFGTYTSTIFQRVNSRICDVLESLGINDIRQQGTSDITIKERKILGCSLYRRRNYFLYQGSLLVNVDASDIGKYLRHPSKEPEYRKRRRHGEFITSLYAEGYTFSLYDMKEMFHREFRKMLYNDCLEENCLIYK